VPAKPLESSGRVAPGGSVNLDFLCPLCQTVAQVLVPGMEEYLLYRAGAYVQDVFPELTPGQRETLISGCHEACFDAQWPDEDEEDLP
jgi:hypothetical protein